MQKIKYITNRELLSEIHNSKNSYCSYLAPEFANFDMIVASLDDVTPELFQQAVESKASKLSSKTLTIDPASLDREEIVIRLMSDTHLPAEADEKRRKASSTGGWVVKTNFPPFRHFILREGKPVEVGRSHWHGGLENGNFTLECGGMSNRLANMFILLVERYSRGGSWRNYCVDQETEALTQRGWLNGDEINEDDIILSYENGQMKWSKIKSIFRNDEYDGKMFHLTVTGMDALVTPHHKFVTDKGLKEVELLIEKDRLVLIGDPVADTDTTYTDEFVELIGWTVTEGSYYFEEGRNYCRVSISQNEGAKADRIRACLNSLKSTFSETHRPVASGTLVVFNLTKEMCDKILAVAEGRVLSMPFILTLSQAQREILINTMVDGDGSRTKTFGADNKYGGYLRYSQKDKKHLDAFLALCTLAGHRTTTRLRDDIVSFGVPTSINEVNIFSKAHDIFRHSMVENIDFHGGKRNGRAHPGKAYHPNEPTVNYKGKIWCPETEYGSFMCRRNGTVYQNGNTYLDEMRSHALVQLAQVGLQFNEARSDNPFSFYTQIIKNCLSGSTMILTREYGSIAIQDVAEQDVTLLDGNGDWVKSHIHDYGMQDTVNLNFSGNFEKVSIRSTLDHGWVQEGTGERINTKHFVDGNGYRTKEVWTADLRPSTVIDDAEEHRRGVIHGLIYGDGSLSWEPTKSYFMRLCGSKVSLESWLDGYTKSNPPSANGDPVYFLHNMWCDLKRLPETPGQSLDYLRGFLRGWLAADGCVSSEGIVTVCGDVAESEWIKQWAPLIGWHFGSYTLLAEVTNFGRRNKVSGNLVIQKRSMVSDDLLRSQHRDQWIETHQDKPKGWRVYPGNRQAIDPKNERVYCPSVPTTGSFALSSGIHSFNCFRRVLNIERRAQDIRDDLLIMAGAMPSYTRQVDNEIEQRDQDGSDSTIERIKGKRGRKPKSAVH